MNKTANKPMYLIILLITVILPITSCRTYDDNKSQIGGQTVEKSPQSILSIEEDIEKIIVSLNGPTTPEAQKKFEVTLINNTSDKTQQQGQQNQQGNQQQNNQQSDNQFQNQKNPWTEVNKALVDIHQKWNNYAPMAVQIGASTQLVEGFSRAINGITKQSLTKDVNKVILAANAAYYFIDDFIALHDLNTPNGLKKMIYYARNSILNGNLGNWQESSSNINSLKSIWSTMQAHIDKDKRKTASKISFSINELDNVVADKSQALTDIKGRIVVSNISELEKQYEK